MFVSRTGSGRRSTVSPYSGTISFERIGQDIAAIASFSESPSGDIAESGCNRPTFSSSWAAACRYVIEKASAVGCESKTDAHGNIHIRPSRCGWECPLWLCGSHLDSVPSGGKYDGVTGVVCALELLRTGVELELIVFAEEEGTTFGLGMLGSRSWVGALNRDELAAVHNRLGESYLEAGAPFGVDAAAMGSHQIDPSRYLGFIEVHPEQGLSLWNKGSAVAVVKRINGRRQYAVTMEGQGNHAGSTRMCERRDAIVGAAQAICEIERLGNSLSAEQDYTVLTVGRLDIIPNALNVIAGRCEFTVDFRAQSSEILDRGDAELRSLLERICKTRQLPLSIKMTEDQPPVPLDETVVQLLRTAARSRGISLPEVPSGALHDAAIVASVLPTAMLFVPSRNGISHHPDEFSRVEDVACAAELVAQVICDSGSA